MESCFPRHARTHACPWKVVNEFLVLLCSCVWLLLYLSNCLYLSPRDLSLLSFTPLQREWLRCCVVLVCPQDFNHNTADHLRTTFTETEILNPNIPYGGQFILWRRARFWWVDFCRHLCVKHFNMSSYNFK